MARTIQADGRTITVPDDATPEEINQIVGPPPSGQHTMGASPDVGSFPWLKSQAMTLRDKVINQLPTVGGVVGGLLGAGGGIESGPGALVTGATGAAAGGGLGETVRQALTEHFHPEDTKMTPTEAATGIGKEAAIQGGSELAGRGVGNILRPATAIDKLAYVGDMHPKAVQQALDELKTTERIPGNKVTTVGDYMNVLKGTKQRLRGEVTDALSAKVPTPNGMLPLGATQADTGEVGLAIQNLMATHPSDVVWNPQQIKKWGQRAAKWSSTPQSYSDIFDRRAVLNEALHKYEALTPGEKAVYEAAHPDIALDKVEADAIRDIVYPKMDAAAGKPAGYFRDLQKRYGGVIETERNTMKRINDLQAAGAAARGGPRSARANASSYMTSSGKPGVSVHRIHSFLKAPAPEAVLDSRVKSAFGHSAATTLGDAFSSNPGVEMMSMPLRDFFTPDTPEESQPQQ